MKILAMLNSLDVHGTNVNAFIVITSTVAHVKSKRRTSTCACCPFLRCAQRPPSSWAYPHSSARQRLHEAQTSDWWYIVREHGAHPAGASPNRTLESAKMADRQIMLINPISQAPCCLPRVKSRALTDKLRRLSERTTHWIGAMNRRNRTWTAVQP